MTEKIWLDRQKSNENKEKYILTLKSLNGVKISELPGITNDDVYKINDIKDVSEVYNTLLNVGFEYDKFCDEFKKYKFSYAKTMKFYNVLVKWCGFNDTQNYIKYNKPKPLIYKKDRTKLTKK